MLLELYHGSMIRTPSGRERPAAVGMGRLRGKHGRGFFNADALEALAKVPESGVTLVDGGRVPGTITFCWPPKELCPTWEWWSWWSSQDDMVRRESLSVEGPLPEVVEKLGCEFCRTTTEREWVREGGEARPAPERKCEIYPSGSQSASPYATFPEWAGIQNVVFDGSFVFFLLSGSQGV